MDVGSAQIEQVKDVPSKLFATIGNFNLPGGFVFSPTYLQAGVVIVCIFLVILAFAMMQRRQSQWTVKGIMPGVAFGFTLALLLEAILLIGGKTLFTELLGWEDAPKPIAGALDYSRERLVDVLGISSGIPEGRAGAQATIGDIMQSYEGLTGDEQESLQSLICPSE